MEQTPDLLEQERDHGRGPVLARLLALLERGCRLRLEHAAAEDGAGAVRPEIAAWAPGVVDACMVLQASRRPPFSRLLEELEEGERDAPGGGSASAAEETSV